MVAPPVMPPGEEEFRVDWIVEAREASGFGRGDGVEDIIGRRRARRLEDSQSKKHH